MVHLSKQKYKKMKHIIKLLLVSVIFFSCGDVIVHESQKNNSDIFYLGIKTIEHDSCEYVIFKDNSHGDVAMLHKQNCKYCKERNKK